LLVAHHQEVTMYIRENWYVLFVLVDFRRGWLEWTIKARPADSRLKRTTRTSFCVYTLLPPDDGLLASPKHVQL
jgi:hypothetical protein